MTLILFVALTTNFLVAAGHDLQRCVEIAALCVMSMVVLARIGAGQLPTVPKVGMALLMTFFALGLVSSLAAYSLRHAIYEWTCLLLLLTMAFSLASELSQDASRLPKLLHWVGIACGLYSLRVLVMYGAALASGFQPDWSVVGVGFSNPRFLNHTQTSLLPLIVFLFLKAPQDSGWRKAWFALTAFWWALLFVTEARATVLALSMGCAIAVLLRRAQAREFIVAMAWTALAGLIVYALGFILLPLLCGLQPIGLPANVVERTVANPSSDRFYLWNLAIKLIASHPWLGVGPQHFAHEGATLYKGAHPHDWVLQIAAEWGIPALLCLAGAIYMGARTLVRCGARLATTDVINQQIFVTLMVSCTAVFVDTLLSGVLVMPQSQLAAVLVLGIACAWVRLQDGTTLQRQPNQSPLKRALLGGLVVTGLCGLIWSVAPNFVQHAQNGDLTPAELAANPEQHWPRMWEAGYF